jgi:hypothetical protein
MGFTHLKTERNPRLGGYRPQIPVLYTLCPQLNSWVHHRLKSITLHLDHDTFQFLWIHCLRNKNNMGSDIQKLCIHLIKPICNYLLLTVSRLNGIALNPMSPMVLELR